MEKYILIYLGVINIISFIFFRIDKIKAINHKRRTPEATLFLVTMLGGTIGAVLSMMIYRHKTQKFSFISKILVITVLQLVLVWSIADYI